MSFLSVEPRGLESHSNSLLAQFAIQLRIIVERYLAFFQERRRVKATYIDSLRKLHRKAKAIDASFDPRAKPTTTRAAWDTIRDDLRRGMHLHTLNCGLWLAAVAEASTQQAFVDILDNDVIKPLRTLKLQQAYLKKYYPQQCVHSTDASQCPQDVPNKRFGGAGPGVFEFGRSLPWHNTTRPASGPWAMALTANSTEELPLTSFGASDGEKDYTGYGLDFRVFIDEGLSFPRGHRELMKVGKHTADPGNYWAWQGAWAGEIKVFWFRGRMSFVQAFVAPESIGHWHLGQEQY
ncbi:hypothetical protein EDB84DRAFT_1443214 [Lactarius hengduanensis]|nr:hypothetical protein EDB84DRAFT_1443214 [Lactarius hengduanensis]